MAKIIGLDEAVELVREGMTIMVGGFMACGGANTIVDAIVAKGTKNLTLIANDAAMPGVGIGRLVENHQLRRLVASHVGLNPQVGQQMASGELEVELVPQGTLVERIRAGGYGLGGILTPTGIGTLVAEGKEIITVDGTPYLLEKPLRADVALICGHTVDRSGNVWYKGTSRNFNQVMAFAGETVIAEADHLVGVGDIAPENVVTPNVLVDYIVEGQA
ncbi:MAG: CoA transferase subunit A [Austwickia sp.]|jgi:acetate CoA/acetoacetate CoA-transferase alpha subunit|nr:MAG: CoA transferase subunit A [Austwickia sp.]